jgi:hypothetical protein
MRILFALVVAFSLPAFAEELVLDAVIDQVSIVKEYRKQIAIALRSASYVQETVPQGTLYRIQAAATTLRYDLQLTSIESELRLQCEVDVQQLLGTRTVRILRRPDGQLALVVRDDWAPYPDLYFALDGLLTKHHCLNGTDNFSLLLKGDVDPTLDAYFRTTPLRVTGQVSEFILSHRQSVCVQAYRLGVNYRCNSTLTGSFVLQNLLGRGDVSTDQLEFQMLFGHTGDQWSHRLVSFGTAEAVQVDGGLGWRQVPFQSVIRFQRYVHAPYWSLQAHFYVRVEAPTAQSYERLYERDGYRVVAEVREGTYSLHLRPTFAGDGTQAWVHSREAYSENVFLRSLNNLLEVRLFELGNGPNLLVRNHVLEVHPLTGTSVRVTLPSGKVLSAPLTYGQFQLQESTQGVMHFPESFRVTLALGQERIGGGDCRTGEIRGQADFVEVRCGGRNATKLQGEFLVKRVGDAYFLVGKAR